MSNLKILMTNSRDANLLAPQYYKYLSQKGIKIDSYYQSDYLEKLTIPQRIINRLFPSLFYLKINKNLLEQVDRFQPDIVWIFKGMETFPSTLEKIKKKGIKLVNYNPDHPFDYISKSSGNNNVLRSISLFDLHICYSKKIAKDLEQKFPGTQTAYLPFGYAFSDEVYESIIEIREVRKTCFVGYGDKERADFVRYLIKNDVEVDVYGQKWNTFFPTPVKGLKVFPAVYGTDYYSMLRKYRVQLNIMRSHNKDSHNMRSFELPAVGGIMLVEDTSEHRDFFEPNQEIFLFSSKEDAIKKINSILNLSEEEANRIRLNARQRSVKSNYSYEGRTNEFLNIIQSFFNIN